MKRREFVANAAGTGAALSLFPAVLTGMEREKGARGLERRALGKTGEKLSIVGLGGVVVMNSTTEQAAERVREAVDAGVNYATWHAGGFGPQVLAKAKEKGMGILCLKAMAKGPWPEGAPKRYAKCWYEPLDVPAEAETALRFALSHPITALVPPGDEGLFRMALGMAARFEPLTTAEAENMKAKGIAQKPLFRYPSAEA